MITLHNGNITYNVEEICYKPYITVKSEEIEGRRFVATYTSPKIFVLKLIGNVREIIFNKFVLEIIDRNVGSTNYIKYNLKNPSLIDFTSECKLIIEVNSWSEEYVEV